MYGMILFLSLVVMLTVFLSPKVMGYDPLLAHDEGNSIPLAIYKAMRIVSVFVAAITAGYLLNII